MNWQLFVDLLHTGTPLSGVDSSQRREELRQRSLSSMMLTSLSRADHE